MEGLTSTLWPIRYKPFEDELLSCWLVRLAHGHGLKVQTFCNLLFGNKLQVWNRDIDRLAPKWLLEELILRTGTAETRAHGTTLRVFEGILYPHFKESGTLSWMLSVKVFHRQRNGYGQQFCQSCLAVDEVPYFRKTWRVALKTFCAAHQCMLWDRCPQCESAVSFHRMDMGRPYVPENGALAACFNCGFNLADAPIQPLRIRDEAAFAWLLSTVAALDNLSASQPGSFPQDEVLVLRHLMRLMMTPRSTVRLRQHVAEHLGIDDISSSFDKRTAFESLPTSARHELLQFGAWILVDPAVRLRSAWRDRAVRYNHLIREFDAAPDWYVAIAERFSEWRKRLL